MVAESVLTTYLDNDDALSIGFIKDLQARALSASFGTVINYNDGYQFYTDHKYLMKIHYPKNHFVSVVERGDPATVKGVRIERVMDQPLWCEVIHGKNMVNDAYFIGAKMVRDADKLRNEFAIDEDVRYDAWLYLFRYMPRYVKTFFVRVKHRLFGWEW